MATPLRRMSFLARCGWLLVAASFEAVAGPQPGAPTIGTATASASAITVAFTAPADPGSSPITSYTATCGTISATGAASPLKVQGLVVGQAYTCTAKATNASGAGPASAASNSVTPVLSNAGAELWSASLQGTGTLPAKVANGDYLAGRRTVAIDASGNVVAAGAVHNGTSNGYDWKVAKFAAATGTVVWQQDFHGGFGDDHVYGVALDASGNAYVVGTAWNGADSDWKVIKYRAADGVLLWQQNLGATGTDVAYGVGVNAAGDAIVYGSVANGADTDWKIVKYRATDGVVQWTRTLAGKSGDRPRAMQVAPSTGDVFIAGQLTSTTPFMTTLRLSGADGSVSWQRTLAFMAAPAPASYAHDLALTADGGVMVAGMRMEPYLTMAYAYWHVVRYAGDGTELLVGPQYTYTFPMVAIAESPGGRPLLVGSSYSYENDTYVARLNANGTAGWARSLGSQNQLGGDVGYISDDLGYLLALDGHGHLVVGSSQKSATRWAVRRYGMDDGSLMWGGEIASGGPSLLHALSAAGDAVYAFGTWTATAGGQAALHVKKIALPEADDTPAPFTVLSREGNAGATVESLPVTPVGYTVPVAVTISNGEYSVGCTGPYTSAVGAISPGQTLCVRNVAGPYVSNNVSTITVGGVTASYTTNAKYPTTTTLLTLSPASVAISGANMSASVKVTSPNGTPASGQVFIARLPYTGLGATGYPTFSYLCIINLNSSGQGSCNTPIIAVASELGLFDVVAYYTGNTSYQRSASAPVPYGLAAATQTIDFDPISEQAVGTVVYANAISTNQLRLNVSFSSLTPSVCTVSNATIPAPITFLTTGTCTIAADQSGDGYIQPAPQVTRTFLVKLGQTISFASPGDRPYTPMPLTLSATAGASGNPVVFATSTPTVCVLSGNSLTLLALGTCTLTANQLGNNDYVAAPTVARSFVVQQAPQTIVFPQPVDRVLGAPAFTLGASGGGSGLPLVLTSTTPTVCSVTRGTATANLLAAGTCTIVASQTGSTLYAAAPPVTRSFQVQAAAARALTVMRVGSGGGTVSGTGISCGADCSESYALGTQVTMTAAAATGSAFAGWSGCPQAAANRCTLTMNANATVTATFNLRLANPSATDFNGDGRADVVLTTGSAFFISTMNGSAAGAPAAAGSYASQYTGVALADLNGDGYADLILRRSTDNMLLVAYYSAGTFAASPTPLFAVGANDTVRAVADFDGDGKADLLVRDTVTGRATVYFMNNAVKLSEQVLFGIAPEWRIEGAADFDRSGRPSLLFRHTVDGRAFAWRTEYAGGKLSLGMGSAPFFTIDPAYEVVQITDWNGDDAPDLVLRHATTGDAFVLYLENLEARGFDWITGLPVTHAVVPRPAP